MTTSSRTCKGERSTRFRRTQWPEVMGERWQAVDDYIAGKLLGGDDALAATLANNSAQGLPPIDVSAAQGKMLFLLAQMASAKRILEVGTLGGYSPICDRKSGVAGKRVAVRVDLGGGRHIK